MFFIYLVKDIVTDYNLGEDFKGDFSVPQEP